jgi:hypothetical protein
VLTPLLLSEPPILARWARVAFATPLDASHWFGYYSQPPLSADGHWLLAHRADFDGRQIKAEDQVEIGCFDLRNGSWRMLGTTRAFNWQQGAMLQWLGPGYNSKVIFNDQEGDQFVARIVDVATGERRTVPSAIYAVHPSGRRALGVRFERHYFCRAYHYEGICDKRWEVPIHPDDGILDIDLETGTTRLLVRTAAIAAIESVPNMAETPHWLEHLLWNPSGTRFGFLHRFGSNENYMTRVFTADPDGKDLFYLSDYASRTYTHMGWRTDQAFVIFVSKSKPLGQAYSALVQSTNPFKVLPVHIYRGVKRFLPRRVTEGLHRESGYALVRDGEGAQDLISTGLLWGDGHPSWTRDGRFMLTDTYADDAGFRHLLLYDAERDHVHSVGKFYSPHNSCSYRCDLHPRFSRDGQYVVIDTAHMGQHQIMVLQLDWSWIAR